jgi:hypothetical protein
MEINANVANQVVASISKLNLNTAKHAFEAQKQEKKDNIEEVVEERHEIAPDINKMAVDVEDIQKYAKYMGENLTIDDINYGLRYGRSVITDYSV